VVPNFLKLTEPLLNLLTPRSMSGSHSFYCDRFLVTLHGNLSMSRFYERAGNMSTKPAWGITTFAGPFRIAYYETEPVSCRNLFSVPLNSAIIGNLGCSEPQAPYIPPLTGCIKSILLIVPLVLVTIFPVGKIRNADPINTRHDHWCH
jgi:hypothetical protein